MKVDPPASLHAFIKGSDDLSAMVNEKANLLFHKLRGVDVQQLEIDDLGRHYFLNHHGGKRLYFSLESSASIIYESLKKNNRSASETNFVDYGAGLGTLFLLAGMMEFKSVVYNDYLENWTANAKVLCHHLGIPISGYVSGDIDELLEYGKKHAIDFHVIASRNVIEHVYDLRTFYAKIYAAYPDTLIYATTTANYQNPAMRLKHHWLHHQVEKKYYISDRTSFIKEKMPGIGKTDLIQLVKITRGKAFEDFDFALHAYAEHKPVPPVEFLSTNTCNCRNGVWAEHLVSKKAYTDIINGAGYQLEYTAGFWDTHYRYGIMNIMARVFNQCIRWLDKKGYWLSPFINIVAYRK